MADNDTRARIILEADKASAEATKRLLSDVSSGVKDLGKAADPLAGRFSRLSKSIAEANVEQFRAAAAAQDYSRGMLKAAQISNQLEEQALQEASALKEVAKAATDANAARKGGDAPDAPGGGGGGGDGRNFLTKFGSTLRNLPSQQIPGLNIGTDAIGNFARLGGAALDAAKAAGILSAAQKGLTAVTGGLSAITTTARAIVAGQTTVTAVASTAMTTLTGTLAAAGPAALSAAGGVVAFITTLSPLAVLGAVVGAGLVAAVATAARLAAESQQANADLADAYEARRAIQEFVRGGATSEEAKARLAQTQQMLEDEQKNLAGAKAAYAESFNTIANGIPIIGDLVARIADLFGAFGAVKDEIKTAEENSKSAAEETRFLNAALEQGKFAAADKKKADEEAAEAAEKAAREAEAHAEKLSAAYERIEESDRQFAFKLEDNARAHGQKLLDIAQGYQDKQRDLTTKYNDDLINIASKARRAEQDAQLKIARSEADAALKDQQSELDAQIKHNRAIEDIRRDAFQDEEDALRERNFLAAANASESARDAVEEANLDAARDAADRAVERERERQERLLDYAREAQDRYTAVQRNRADALNGYNQQNRDARLQMQRQLRDAQTAYERQNEMTTLQYTREQQQLQSHYNQLLGIAANGQAAERALRQGANAEQVLRNAGTSNTTNSSTNINDNRSWSFPAGGFGGATGMQQFIQREVISTMQAIRYKR